MPCFNTIGAFDTNEEVNMVREYMGDGTEIDCPDCRGRGYVRKSFIELALSFLKEFPAHSHTKDCDRCRGFGVIDPPRMGIDTEN